MRHQPNLVPSLGRRKKIQQSHLAIHHADCFHAVQLRRETVSPDSATDLKYGTGVGAQCGHYLGGPAVFVGDGGTWRWLLEADKNKVRREYK